MVSVTPWYRVVARRRESREDVLKSAYGRFHEHKDLEPTTYVADSLATAWKEVSAHFGGARPDPRQFRAWRVVVKAGKLTDLRDRKERERQMITEEELKADPAPARCREVARALRNAAKPSDGLLYPSVRQAGGTCAAIFLEWADERIDLQPVSDEEWERFVEEALPWQ